MTEAPAFVSAEDTVESAKPAPTKSSSRNSRINNAKRIVVDNYNEHHNSDRTPRLSMAVVYIVSFTEMFDSWKATVASTVVRGLIYEVSYNARIADNTIRRNAIPTSAAFDL